MSSSNRGVTIHQPEHMPWLGFFHKISMVDTLVVLDNVQYRRRYFQNRNKIRTAKGWQWVTVPLERESRDDLLISNAKISTEDKEWRKSNLDKIYQNYRGTKYFEEYWKEFESIYGDESIAKLADLNIVLLKYFLKHLGISVEIILGSSLSVSSKKGDLIFDICKSVEASTYVSGISGKDYLDVRKFKGEGIDVKFQEFHHPIYQQHYEPFVPYMSVCDLLFNHGKDSLDMINGKNVSVLEEVLL